MGCYVDTLYVEEEPANTKANLKELEELELGLQKLEIEVLNNIL